MSKIYCVYCGTKNKDSDKQCSKCKKKLNPIEHPFKDYLYNHIRDDLKGKVTDSIISLIENFIKSHIYGTLMSAVIIFTITSGIIGLIGSRQGYIEKVNQRPNLIVENDLGHNEDDDYDGEYYTVTLYPFAECCDENVNKICDDSYTFRMKADTRLKDNVEFMNHWLVKDNNNQEWPEDNEFYEYQKYLDYSNEYNETESSYNSCMNSCTADGTRWGECNNKCEEQYDYYSVPLPSVVDLNIKVNNNMKLVARSGCGA